MNTVSLSMCNWFHGRLAVGKIHGKLIGFLQAGLSPLIEYSLRAVATWYKVMAWWHMHVKIHAT